MNAKRVGRTQILISVLISVLVSGCCGEYEDKIKGLEKTLAEVRNQKAEVEAAKATSESSLNARIASLVDYQKALESELEKLGVDRKKLSEQYQEAQNSLEAKQRLIAEMNARAAQAQQRLDILKNMLGKFKSMIETGKLKVKVKNNKMVLELPSAILFESGKADLSKDGQATLSQVASVLATITSREFQVAGHTDNVPLTSKSRFRTNWELSTARAVAVVTFMQKSGVTPTSLSAAGYSEYQPSMGNDTEDHKAMNRRIEITLMPNIEELPDLSALEKML